MWDFKVGDEVVCVADNWQPALFDEQFPKRGEIYTIRTIDPAIGRPGHVVLRLEEIVNPTLFYGRAWTEASFISDAFRPLKSFSLDALLSTKVDIGETVDG